MPPRAVLTTLAQLWHALAPLDLPMAVLGGLALAVWKHPRSTQDVDLMLGVDADRLPVAALQAAGFRPKRGVRVKPLGMFAVSQWQYTPEEQYVDVDVDLLLADSEYHHQAIRRAVSLPLPGVDMEICVLACEDMILHKLMAGRLIDRADVATLLQRNRETIDKEYLERWGGCLGLLKELETAVRDARGSGSGTAENDEVRS